ncbi:MAG: DUF484 family protein [Paracoccus sp. (in: a-proteobacteria)]|uniref:DUF484 family protein n=1 Tax=Paracoccus sp. TaxID=267 RepID=UPI0026E0C38F|nr:DUF484 family protein [Paracoccus sp. (in: a-proteobacteria)]MDO5622873.1 DUF484 family protein [Paracoccus sp. (in: a-proteobacteria)]
MTLDPATRDKLLADPSALLEDRDLMRALVAADQDAQGGNVIDIRGRAMEVLEGRLDRLETAHETVISAAYENQSGTALVHRAVLAMLEPVDLAGFVQVLEQDVAPMLRIETLRLVIEGDVPAVGPGLVTVTPGTTAEMLSAGRRSLRGAEVILRAAVAQTRPLHGQTVRSEALIPLDLGPDGPPALLLMGAAEAGRFSPAQGTDLLRFFGQVVRLNLLRWLRD